MSRRWRTVHGYDRSRAAEEAEDTGELPLTRATDFVYREYDCKRRGITRRQVREFLEANCNRGWHHVAGPSVRAVGYYSTDLTEDEKRMLLASAKKSGQLKTSEPRRNLNTPSDPPLNT